MAANDFITEHGTSGYQPGRFDPVPLDESRRAWFKMPGESTQAYEAFMTYLTIPPDERTLRKTALVLGKSISLMEKWSRRWSWSLRVGAYEEHYLLLKLESAAAERDRMWFEQKSIAERALTVVDAKLAALIGDIGQDGKLGGDAVKMDALVRLLDVATKIQRISVIGRADNAEKAREENEKLTDRYAEELVQTLEAFINRVELTDEQQERAKEALDELLVGGDHA